MCCRYVILGSAYMDVEELLQDLHYVPYDTSVWPVEREVRPSDNALVITGDRKLQACSMPWGYFTKDNKLLINARSETATEKPTFREGIRRRRCVIPASRFCEWDRTKNMATFSMKEEQTMYLAGIFDYFYVAKETYEPKRNVPSDSYESKRNVPSDSFRFTVLTTAANASMKKTHDRMPLILGREQVADWLFDDKLTGEFLKQNSPELNKYQEYEQLSLF